MKRLSFLLAILTVFFIVNNVDAGIEIVSGDDQRGVINAPLPEPLVVKIIQRNGNPARNREVTFTALTSGDSFQHETVYTNDDGIAQSHVMIGSQRYSHRFRVEDQWQSVEFSAYIHIPTCDGLDHAHGNEPDIYKKWNGTLGETDESIPDLHDWSYAGYKQNGLNIPETFPYPVFNVLNYGADRTGRNSSVSAFRDAINAAKRNGSGIIYFPRGLYVFFTEDESAGEIQIRASNIIVKGDGAGGYEKGGTTLKFLKTKNYYVWDTAYIKALGSNPDWSRKTRVNGDHAIQTMSINVDSTATFTAGQFITIGGQDSGDKIYRHVSKTASQIREYSELKSKGVRFYERHQIDRIEGNTLHLKSPVTFALSDDHPIVPLDTHQHVGFEDFHLDGGFTGNYEHLKQRGHNGISVRMPNSFIRRVRFTDCINPFSIVETTNVTAHSIVIDGKGGHYTAWCSTVTNIFIGLLEDYSDKKRTHGISITGNSAGNVCWKMGGKTLPGPDAHRACSRLNLFDNNVFIQNNSQSGANDKLPHHLDGWIMWNCKSWHNHRVNLWTSNKWGHRVTGGAYVGWISPNQSESPQNVYYVSFGTHVNPMSLYIAQLQARDINTLHIEPVLLQHRVLFTDIRGGNFPPQFVESVRKPKRYISANAAIGTNIGTPIRAVDREEMPLTYKIVQNDDPTTDTPFDINRDNGQLTVKSELSMDQRYYDITVRATDRNRQYTDKPIFVVVYPTQTGFVPLSDREPEIAREIYQQVLIANRQNLLDRRYDNLGMDGVTADMVSKVISLNLRGHVVGDLENGDFNGLVNCYSIDLRNSDITQIGHNAFEGLDNCVVIRLGFGDIHTVYGTAFYHTPKLELLDISNNEIQYLHKDHFAYLPELNQLDLSDNNVTKIMTGLFVKNPKLNQLSFNRNDLDTIELNAFVGMPGLRRLLLKDNDISDVSELEYLTQLDYLGVSGNPFTNYDPLGRLLANNPDMQIDIDMSNYLAPKLLVDNVDTALLANYPNPFNPETWIPYQLSKSVDVSLTIYDVTGNTVRHIELGQKGAGKYIDRAKAIYWDGKNNVGEQVATGIYFYTLQAGDFHATRKMLILK